MTRHTTLVLLAAAAIAGSGCSHAMRITNLHEYAVEPAYPLDPAMTVGVRPNGVADPVTRGYVDAVADGLRRDGSFVQVLYPYDGRREVDAVVDVAVSPIYSGEGSNFLVNWPGFLIFAPAIWGYGYQAAIDTRVSIWTRDGATRELAIPTRYRFRQAEIDRTWTEIGWLEIGIIPLVGGLVFTGYDADLTPEFVSRVGPSYGAYVSRRIREALAAAPPAVAPAPRQAPASAAAVVPGS